VASASRVLASYAAFLSGLEAKSTELHHSRTNVEARIAKNPFDALALLDIVSLGLAEHALLRRAQSAADEAAQALLALVDEEVSGHRHWWDPFGIWDDDSVPDASVDEHTLDRTNWDPAYVQQGNIGDCYLVSTVMGYMSTSEGRAMLQNNIRWDSKAGGYWVTLYDHGKPKEYFVGKVYGQGADQVDGQTLWWTNTSHNVVNLYEAAYAQMIGYDDLDDGGKPDFVMAAITGEPASHQALNRGNADGDLAYIDERLSSGSPVVAWTTSRSTEYVVENATIVRPDGKVVNEDIDIVSGPDRSHAYSVERVDSDGTVWVRNPWGPGNSADGGGLIGLSAEQFESAFCELSAESGS
jgi:cbb3-type cytochrome oxidase subunit 3